MHPKTIKSKNGRTKRASPIAKESRQPPSRGNAESLNANADTFTTRYERPPFGKKRAIARAPRCPTELSALIKACNALPWKVMFEDDINPKILRYFRGGLDHKTWGELVGCKILPEGDDDSFNESHLAPILYEKVELHKLVRLHRWASRPNQESPSSGEKNWLRWFGKGDPPVGVRTLTLNHDLTLSPSRKGALFIIMRSEIPIDRIQTCAICEDLFWVRRRGTQYCPKSSCKWAQNKRNQRAKNEETSVESLEVEIARLSSRFGQYRDQVRESFRLRIGSKSELTKMERETVQTNLKCFENVLRLGWLESRAERAASEDFPGIRRFAWFI